MAIDTSSEASVAELRRDADRTRAHLTGTVEELRSQVTDTAAHIRDAVSPSTIKRQVKDYARESSEDLLQSLQRRARENPLQAVAIGAMVAYPLWNMVRAIPTPLLLIGAGLALSGSSAVREATDDAMAKARDTATDAMDAARQKMHDARDAAGSMVERATALASSAQDQATALATSAKDRVDNTIKAATGGSAGTLEKGNGALDAASDTIASLASQTRDSLGRTYDQNPLLIAGIGLAVGALIASSLPATETENRIFGDTSEKLRRRAADAAAQGLDTAKEVATDVVEAASAEGLSVEGMSLAADEVTRKARAVAERGVKTALGDTPR